MKRIQLKSSEYALLLEVLERDAGLLKQVLHNASISIPLQRSEVEAVRDLIADELASTGVGDDGAINKRGMALDDLIDRFPFE